MTAQSYQIIVKGQLQPEWAARLEEIEIVPLDSQQYILHCAPLDPPALHGLLDRIRALGLELVSVKVIPAGQNPDLASQESNMVNQTKSCRGEALLRPARKMMKHQKRSLE